MIDVAVFVGLASLMVFGSVAGLMRAGAGEDGRPIAVRRSTGFALLAGVPIAVALIYARLGSIASIDPAPPDPVRTVAEQRTAALAARLSGTSDDVAGLRLLARSYEQLRRWPEAATIRSRLVALDVDDPDALVDLAETVSMTQGGSYVGEPIALVRRALAIDDGNRRALASLANDAAERGDLRAAVTAWRRILHDVPSDSAVADALRVNIASAETDLASDRPSPTPTPR